MDILSIFFNMKVYCVFSLESPHHRGDSNEYTQYTIFNITRKCVYETLCPQPYACPEKRFKSERKGGVIFFFIIISIAFY